MGLISRIFGICRTKPPADSGCWRYEDESMVIDVARAEELKVKGGAMRLEGSGLPVRVLVLRGEDNELYAFKNRCSHAARKLDPLPGRPQVQCCSVGKSTFDYSGLNISGSAKSPVDTFPVQDLGDKLVIFLGTK